MLQVFNLTLSKVGMLLIFIGVGYLLRRSHKLPDDAGRVLSLLCVMIFSPAYSILNLSKNLRMEVLGEKLTLVGYGLAFAAVAIGAGLVLGKLMGRSPVDKSSLTYAFTFPNYGYFGYPVIEGVFGTAMLGEHVYSACGSDMMSDVLAYVKDQAVLLTGLMNTQVVRTAEMMDMRCIVFVRSKQPTPEIVELAEESGIVLLATPKRMYEACGILYANGLVGNKVKE